MFAQENTFRLREADAPGKFSIRKKQLSQMRVVIMIMTITENRFLLPMMKSHAGDTDDTHRKVEEKPGDGYHATHAHNLPVHCVSDCRQLRGRYARIDTSKLGDSEMLLCSCDLHSAWEPCMITLLSHWRLPMLVMLDIASMRVSKIFDDVQYRPFWDLV
jgi:hypothetical protein